MEGTYGEAGPYFETIIALFPTAKKEKHKKEKHTPPCKERSRNDHCGLRRQTSHLGPAQRFCRHRGQPDSVGLKFTPCTFQRLLVSHQHSMLSDQALSIPLEHCEIQRNMHIRNDPDPAALLSVAYHL